jgi:hypothetical protein
MALNTEQQWLFGLLILRNFLQSLVEKSITLHDLNATVIFPGDRGLLRSNHVYVISEAT